MTMPLCAKRLLAAAVLATAMVLHGGPIAVIAHRGWWQSPNAGGAQNSLAALKAAQDAGFRGAEFDIHMTVDEVVVVRHDNQIRGTNIWQHVYADIAETRLPNGERMPTHRRETARLPRGMPYGAASGKRSSQRHIRNRLRAVVLRYSSRIRSSGAAARNDRRRMDGRFHEPDQPGDQLGTRRHHFKLPRPRPRPSANCGRGGGHHPTTPRSDHFHDPRPCRCSVTNSKTLTTTVHHSKQQ